MPISRPLLAGLIIAALGITGGCEAEQPLALEVKASSDFDPEDGSLRYLYSGDSIRIRWRTEGLSVTAVRDGKLRLRACVEPGNTVQSPPYSYGTNFTMAPVPAGFWDVFLAIESQVGTSDSIPPLPIEIPSNGSAAGITLERVFQHINVTVAATRDRKVGGSWVAVGSASIPVFYRTFRWDVEYPPCPPHEQGSGG
jgi:hypothetical protein